jgi:uncharacterized membrane protein
MSTSNNHQMRWAWIGIGAFILIAVAVLSFAIFMRFGAFSRGYYGMPMMGGGGLLLGLIGLGLLCLFGFVASRFMFWGPMSRRPLNNLSGDNAEEILRQRYARSEITKEHFDQMLRDLREANK